MGSLELEFSQFRIPHASQSIFDLDVAELLVSLCFDLLQKFALCRQNLFEGFLKCWLGRRGIATCLHCVECVSWSSIKAGDSIAYQKRKGE